MEHTPLPECIDRLARIEAKLENICDNHLEHLYEGQQALRRDLKDTQKFFIAQIIGLGMAAIALLVKVLFIG